MTVGEATSRFLAHSLRSSSTVNRHAQTEIHEHVLVLLTNYFSKDAQLREITPSSIRDFLSRWYVESVAGSIPIDATSVSRDTGEGIAARQTDVVKPLDLLDSIEEFVGWAGQQTGIDQATSLLPVLNELRLSLPRALEITKALTSALRTLGGAFTFPEFLTSFEDGGSSQYDIDVPGNVGSIDGYFRIGRVEDLSVEAVELIAQERVWPIIFPAEAAALLDEGYIVNLELVRNAEGWQIVGCGFTYPPGSDIR